MLCGLPILWLSSDLRMGAGQLPEKLLRAGNAASALACRSRARATGLGMGALVANSWLPVSGLRALWRSCELCLAVDQGLLEAATALVFISKPPAAFRALEPLNLLTGLH